MALRHRMEYLRKEHEELLSLAGRIEKLLESASKNDFSERLKSLTELRSLEHGFAGIVEHCHAADRVVESTYYEKLRQDERARIDAEHQQIIQAVASFREELKCATGDRTMAMILPGIDLVNQLRAHIPFEREALGRIAELGNPPKRTARKKTSSKRAHEKKRRHVAKRKTRVKANYVMPYTLEPHPEL